ncbi:MAG TPA: trigger factor [Oligoflexus sp.]|uniref:trigger factor n=1 Tax=Oligoflexus sp. TaxID=1971216 RepID=UPI002D7FAD58|nr:trigger factor [Oligoflexus sp.]HET9240943.1 trigger factor [Oligoflexus sp.]
MKALVEEVNTVQRRIKVELSAVDVKSAFDSVYRKLQQKARINGFRPGKAPMNVIRKMYGSSIAYDVADQLVRNHLFSAIEQQSLRPIAAPVLETMDLPKEDNDYSFSALVDILPALKIEGYKGLNLEASTSEVSDADVERELEMIQRRHAKTKDAEEGTAAGANHLVTISQKAKVDGEEFPEFTFESVPVELGKKYLLPELEDALTGMKAGEEKELSIQVPEHVNDKSKVGKTAQCTVKLEKVVEILLPEINDELAKDMGVDSLDALKTNIRDRLQRQAEGAKRSQLETAIFDQLSASNNFEVPPSMVDQVIDSMFDEMEFQNDAQRKAAKSNEDERKRLRDTAKQRAKNTLILSEIIKSESIQVNDDDFDSYVKELVGGAQAGKELDAKLIESIKASMGPHARESLLFKKALDFVIDNAKVTESAART